MNCCLECGAKYCDGSCVDRTDPDDYLDWLESRQPRYACPMCGLEWGTELEADRCPCEKEVQR